MNWHNSSFPASKFACKSSAFPRNDPTARGVPPPVSGARAFSLPPIERELRISFPDRNQLSCRSLAGPLIHPVSAFGNYIRAMNRSRVKNPSQAHVEYPKHLVRDALHRLDKPTLPQARTNAGLKDQNWCPPQVPKFIMRDGPQSNRPPAESALPSRGIIAALVENSQDAIYATTPSGIVLTWNSGAQALLGYTAIEAIGQSVAMLVAPNRLAYVTEFMDRVSRGPHHLAT